MSKRRRTSSIASRSHEDDSLDSLEASTGSGASIRKRLKKQDPMELCQQLYDSIRNHKKDDGTLLCDSFIRVPKRRQEPGYHEVVSNPMDLLKVQQKLKTEEYEDIEDLQADIELIVDNTKAFYKRSSHEYKDAVDLWALFLNNKQRLLTGSKDDDGVSSDSKRLVLRMGRSRKVETPVDSKSVDLDHSEDTSESSTNPDEEVSQYEELFTAVMTATDGENRPLHTPFQLIPSRKKYPEYFEVIEQPIDLKSIAIKIQNNEYINLSEMERDLMLMAKNACLFNEPGSQIYKNAKLLKKIIQTRKIEIEHSKNSGGKSSERIRNKRLRGSTCLSAVTAALRDEESDDTTTEDADEELLTDGIDPDDPQWQLFQTVTSVTNVNGTPLSEAFWKLPSKRIYPDYYREIKNPVSLAQIRRKLTNQSYGTVSEVAGDLTIMFENAKKYNIPTSKLYKDAIKLQKIMQARVQELLDIDQDIDMDGDADLLPAKKKCNSRPRTSPSSGNSLPRGRPHKDSPIVLRRRLHSIAKHVLDATCEDGRKPILGFMEKPSKKLYSAYYDVISDPIDFLDIESKIRNDHYSCDDDLVQDFKLMFANCRQFNEENSPIYDDSILLEKILMEKVNQLQIQPQHQTVHQQIIHQNSPQSSQKESPIVNSDKKDKIFPKAVRVRRIYTPLERSLKTLYESIRDYREPKANRQLSSIFMKLPSKIDYPDYYEVIKQPIDMEKISQRVRSNGYDNLDDLVADFILMFDNACKYNEPDSHIYKDALVLQRVCLQTKLQLKEASDTVPDVAAAVQDILLNLFTTVYNHQDNDEHCFSDSLAELPEHDEIDGKKVRAVSLDLIKRRLDRGTYKRLDAFQEDLFSCLERARRLSRSDSQVFEDATELQSFYIRQRDSICRNGDLLQSPALAFTLMDLSTSVESLRQSKLLEEALEEEENETRCSSDDLLAARNDMDVAGSASDGNTMVCNQQTFNVGEFVYYETKETKGCDPHILLIERLWKNNEGQQMLYGTYYLRPAETFHLTTRKFWEKEVFKSDTHIAIPLEEVKERCCVLSSKNYYTMRPEGYDDNDVYLCDCRYSTRSRSFKKMKIFPENPSIKLVPREPPLEPKRVVSVFRERIEKHKDELAELQEQEKLIEKDKPNVISYISQPSAHRGSNSDDGAVVTFYDQYNTICGGVVKTGDFVYVATNGGGRQSIAQIDTIWETKDGKCYFRGPWLMLPNEVSHPSAKLVMKQEIYLSTVEETNNLVSIVGKCSVLDCNEYASCRITEIPESDVFVCNSLFDEIKRQIRKLPAEGLKKYQHSPVVTEDEIYYFPKSLHLSKDAHCHTPHSVGAPPKMAEIDVIMEDSLDGGPSSVGSGETTITTPIAGNTVVVSNPTTPATSSRRRPTKNKTVTGYILYSREVRRQVSANNPDSNFGEISRIVGNEWRSLPTVERQMWEERASKSNEEVKALQAVEERSSPVPSTFVYECLWDGCDYQFEDLSDCLEHCVKDRDVIGHVQTYFQTSGQIELQCLWKNCSRRKRNMQPFPNLSRLLRHIRDLHVNKGNGRTIPIAEKSKNFINRRTGAATPQSNVNVSKHQSITATSDVITGPTATSTLVSSGTATASTTSSQNMASAAVTSSPQAVTPIAAPVLPVKNEPMFISIPPRPQRVLHSEAYIKYIEGLQAENRSISNWEKCLNATQENTPAPDPEKINQFATWLGKRADQHSNVVTALWNLRNQLLKDTLGLQKFV